MPTRRPDPNAPLVLAADTSTLVQSVALARGDAVIAELTVSLPRGHSRALLSSIDTLLRGAELTLEAVDLLAIGLGPGSFTGLRIGLALFKGLSLSYGKPLYGASSLEAIAARHTAGGAGDALVCGCIDARKGELYAALYEPTGEPQSPLRALVPECVLPPGALVDELLLAAPSSRPVLFAGSGALEYGSSLAARLGPRARFASALGAHPWALDVARQALARHARGAHEPLATLEPRYVRPSDVELGNPGNV